MSTLIDEFVIDPVDMHRKLDSRQEVLPAFLDVASAAPDIGCVEDLLMKAVTNACPIFGVDRCSIFIRSGLSPVFHGVAARSPGDSTLVKRLRCGVGSDRMSPEIVQFQRPVLVSDVMADSRPVRSTMRELNVKEVLGVPLIVGSDVCGLMFLDRVGHARHFSNADTSAAAGYAKLVSALLPVTNRIVELNRTVAELTGGLREVAQARAAMAEFDKLTNNDGTPQDIVNLVSRLTHRACMLVDSRYQPIVRSPDRGAPPATMQDLLHAPELAASQFGDVVTVGTEASSLLVCPVMVSGSRWGHLVLKSSDTHPRVKRILARGAAAIAAELRISAIRAAGLTEDRSALIRAWVEGNRGSAIGRLATRLSIKTDTPRLVCLVQRRAAGSETTLDSGDVAQAFAAEFNNESVLATAVDGGTVVLLDATQVDIGCVPELRRRVDKVLRRADPEELVAAIPMPPVTAERVHNAYREAQRLMNCLRELCAPSVSTLTGHDLGFAAPLLTGVTRDAANYHVDSVLVGSDGRDPRRLEQLRTVHTFLRHGRSVRDAARHLGVHENTIRYRLAKFHAATGNDMVGDMDDQVKCQLAFVILRLRSGVLDAPDIGPLFIAGAPATNPASP